MIRIDGANSSGVKIVAEIEAECFDKPWSEQDIAGCLGSGAAVAVLGECGYAVGVFADGEGELYRIAVKKAFRGQGRGAELLAAFTSECRGKAPSGTIFLEVRAKNTPARRLYEGFGFTALAVRKDYYGDDDAVIYRYDF